MMADTGKRLQNPGKKLSRTGWEKAFAYLWDLRAELAFHCFEFRSGAYGDPSREYTQPRNNAWLDQQLSNLQKPLEDNHLTEIARIKVQAAWRALRTPQNRQRALELVYNAYEEKVEELRWQGFSFRSAIIKQQRAWYNKFHKARTQAEKAGRQFLSALDAYYQAAAPLPLYGPQPPVHETIDAWLALQQCLRDCEALVARLQGIPQIPEIDPIARKPEQKSGRKEKPALNAAIQGLKVLFHESGIKAQTPALRHTVSMLYAAGVWFDDEPSGLAAKVSGLQQRSRPK
jgi:hypothetical protein